MPPEVTITDIYGGYYFSSLPPSFSPQPYLSCSLLLFKNCDWCVCVFISVGAHVC